MSFEEMKAKLKAAKEKQSNNNSTNATRTGASEMYPHWNMPDGSTTKLRFLPDGDNNNPFFWREVQKITLTFSGVEGHPEAGEVKIQVPCVRMYDPKNVCPILSTTRSWWGTDKEELARKYWPKKTYLYQGFVRSSELVEDETPENPIRRFVISKQIHKIIENSITDDDMDNDPTDVTLGCDFKITKTKAGKFADYNNSSFARSESALSEEEVAAINEYGLFDLKTYMPNEPDSEQLQMIEDMFHESLKTSSEYKLEWLAYLRPYGVQFTEAELAEYGKPSAKPKAANNSAPTGNATTNTDADADDSIPQSTHTSDVAQSAIDALRARIS